MTTITVQMPKLPLFQDEPLDLEAIASFRHLLEHPETPGNIDLISDPLNLRNDPHSPISEPLAAFVISSGLLRSVMLENFLSNSAGHPHETGKRGAMQLQTNQRVLACAAAAGFPAPQAEPTAPPRHRC